MGHRLHRFPLCKLSCLIIGDQRCPPPLNLSHCPFGGLSLAVRLLCGYGIVFHWESGFASSIFVIYAELNRHVISRKRENAGTVQDEHPV